jgi:hypothetical protein
MPALETHDSRLLEGLELGVPLEAFGAARPNCFAVDVCTTGKREEKRSRSASADERRAKKGGGRRKRRRRSLYGQMVASDLLTVNVTKCGQKKKLVVRTSP